MDGVQRFMSRPEQVFAYVDDGVVRDDDGWFNCLDDDTDEPGGVS